MFEPTNPQNAAIIEKLASALTATSIGSIVSYHALKKAAPGWLPDKQAWLLAKAKEQTERNLGCAFATVRGVGIKRLPTAEIPDIGLSALGRIRRHAKHQKRRLDRINSNSLSPTEQRRVIGMSAMLGAVAVVADGRRATAVAAVADPAKPIPPGNILAMFQQDQKS